MQTISSLPVSVSQDVYVERVARLWGSPANDVPDTDQERMRALKDTVLEETWLEYSAIYAALAKGEYLVAPDTMYRLDSRLKFICRRQSKFTDEKRSVKFIVNARNDDSKQDQSCVTFRSLESPYFFMDFHEIEFFIQDCRLNWKRLLQHNAWSVNFGSWSLHKRDVLIRTNTTLTHHVSGTCHEAALAAIQAGADVNRYSVHFGTNPLTLALWKGYTHRSVLETPDENHVTHQKPIIDALLTHVNIDVNVFDLITGSTPLHIACLRGDDPEIVKRLLAAGANKNHRDYKGQRPVEMLDVPYTAVQSLVAKRTGNEGARWRTESWGTVCMTATLPLEDQHLRNRSAIAALLADDMAADETVQGRWQCVIA